LCNLEYDCKTYLRPTDMCMNCYMSDVENNRVTWKWHFQISEKISLVIAILQVQFNLKKKLCMTAHNGNNKSFHLHHVNKRTDKNIILTLTYAQNFDFIFGIFARFFFSYSIIKMWITFYIIVIFINILNILHKENCQLNKFYIYYDRIIYVVRK